MSINKVVFFALSVLLVFHDATDGKKVRRKRPKAEEEVSYLQPNVLTYSNFGFNDVGSYDGFVPSSPDYATFLRSNGGKVESTTRLYGPAFPTAMETSGFSSGLGSQLSDGQSFNVGNDGQQLGLFHLEPNTMNSFTSSFTNVDSASENKMSDSNSMNIQNMEKSNMPVYGAKINMKGKSKQYDDFNDSNFKTYTTDAPTTSSNDKYNERYYKSKKRYHSFENKQTTTESSSNQNKVNNIPNYPINVEPFMKTPYNHTTNLFNFPRVIDFTNTNKQFYQNDFQVNYPSHINTKPLQMSNSAATAGHDTNSYTDHGDKFFKVSSSIKNGIEYKDANDKNVKKFNPNSIDDESHNHSPKFKGTVTNVEYKDKVKTKPWKVSDNELPDNTNNDIPVSSSKFVSNVDDFKSEKSSMKGYQYSTNHSTTSFKFDVDEAKKPFKNSVDEVVPASSNIDLLDYQFPSTDFTNFNKISNFKAPYEDEIDLSFNTPNQYKPSEEYLNKFKNLYTTTPTSTSNWGNIFKSTEYSFNKSHKRKPEYGEENIADEIVHIPKRPQSQKYGKYDFKSGDTSNEFPYISNYRPYKSQRPQHDWGNEISSTRFKSEEDLLGLRTRDTSRPSFLPTFSSKPNEVADDNNYKRLIEKWRIDYLKSKQKEAFHDYESYASDAKPVHVPLPKPYPIEVPHPVIIPVPEPYPVRVPVPRPVAVPVIQELMVPIEKPVPYPVVKKVPFPIEKLVPVPVEKQVPVPVEKPYPVPIPQIRPVFHHTRHRDEYNNLEHDDDDYLPRPESSKRVPYVKRPKSTRNRPRRPSRTAYPEGSRRRLPQLQASESKEQRYFKRPPTSSKESPHPRYRHRDREHEDFDHEDRDFLANCKRTGNC